MRISSPRLQEIVSWLAALLFLVGGSAGVAQENRDQLKQRITVQAQSVSPNDYAFTRTSRTRQTSGDKTEQKTIVEKFDPAKPAGQQWMLVSIDGAAPSAEALKEFQSGLARRRVPGYHRLAGYFGSPAASSTDSSGRTVFHFAKLPKESVRVFDTDVSQNTTADAAVNDNGGQPFVEEVRLTVRPMRIKLIAKLERYESTARYRVGAEGKPVLVEQTADVVGSGMGKEGRVHTVTTYDDYRRVGGKQ